MESSAEQQRFGRYSFLRKLATGGMAEIFLARKDGTPELVVVKKVLPHLSERLDFMQMFLDEARIAARLAHPNVVQILDLGKVGNDLFLSMEFIHGIDVARLRERVRLADRLFPAEVVCRIVSDACAGLHYAHTKADDSGRQLGIVHRDVSPQNILVRFDGHVKIVDFGVARAVDRLTKTRTGILKGKHSYMSPEQAQGHKFDHRTDVFALGVVLHELLCGQRLFKRGTELLTLKAVVECKVPAPSELRPELPVSLDAVCRTALAKNPDERYPSCKAFRDALEEVIAKEGLAATRDALARFARELCPDKLALDLPPEPDAAGPTIGVDPRLVQTQLQSVPDGAAGGETRSPAQQQPPPEAPPADTDRGPVAAAEAGRTPVQLSPTVSSLEAVPSPAPRESALPPTISGPARAERPAPTAPAPGATATIQEPGRSRSTPHPRGTPPGAVAAAAPAPAGGAVARLRRYRDLLIGVATGALLVGAVLALEGVFSEPEGVTLQLTSDPPGAAIVINGIEQGRTTPADVVVRPRGPARLGFRLDGYEPEELTLEPGAPGARWAPPTVVLEPLPPPPEPPGVTGEPDAGADAADAEPEASAEEVARVTGARRHRDAATALTARRKHRAALGHLVEAIRLEPDDAETHRLIAACYSSLSDHRKAAEHYRRVLELAPDHPQAEQIRRFIAGSEKKGRRRR